MGNMETFTHEVVTWTNRINNYKKINWKFTSNHANRKLLEYYLIIHHQISNGSFQVD